MLYFNEAKQESYQENCYFLRGYDDVLEYVKNIMIHFNLSQEK